jgi:hypothetical protein
MMEDLMKMMTKCCSSEGKPGFENMKKFMETCGKKQFSEEESRTKTELCGSEGMSNCEEVKVPTEECRCQAPLNK